MKYKSTTTHLLHLKLDGTLDIVDFVDHLIAVSDHRGKLSRFVQPGSKESRDLFDQSVGSHETVVFLRQFLHEFLVLVQLL